MVRQLRLSHVRNAATHPARVRRHHQNLALPVANLHVSVHQNPAINAEKTRVVLSDGKARSIQHFTVTSYWHPDGTPMTSQKFLEMLFGELPSFFKEEDDLRELWSKPDTRAALLKGLEEKGFGASQLEEMQRIIDAQHSDLYDVLAYIRFASQPETREERAERAKARILSDYQPKYQTFLMFVLGHYIKVGVRELNTDKLYPLLKLKYQSIEDAKAVLGAPTEIGRAFTDFQKWLYVRG
jgi:type I restriction enzyme R subunit